MIVFYDNGTSFYSENKNLLEKDYKALGKIKSINSFDVDNYCIKVFNTDKYLFAIYNKEEGLTLLGFEELCIELVEIIFISNLNVDKVNNCSSLSKKFIQLYTIQSSGSFVWSETGNYYKYTIGNIKKAIFAGGCFWCIASNYYSLDGVIDVYSGYAGGTIFFPTYQKVKSGVTNHMESICILYDETKISYYQLLKIYFENIDPFDGDGQFIDRGSSYQTAVFTSHKNEIEIYNQIKEYIEHTYKKDIAVKLLQSSCFFLAEEEHQHFSQKNKEKFEHEEIISGRSKYQGIKL